MRSRHLSTFDRIRQFGSILMMATAALLFSPASLANSESTGQKQCRVMIHGDSLSAAYGLKREDGWVNLLAARLAERRPACEVINTSISGETTAGGLSRLPALLERHKPSHVVLELGANDGLRGLDTQAMQSNLEKMVKQSQTAGARVALVGVRIPPNYGKAYQERFDGVFIAVARQFRIPRVSSLLL